jgi:2-iminobutanoate/2-iminopropanoate deaminase
LTHENKLHNPSTIAPPARNLYAHAVEVPKASRHLYVAGQVGVRPDGSVPESLEEQTEQMMENIREVLASAGMTFADIVKFNAYCMSGPDIITYAGIRNRHFDGVQTATTAVVVAGLADPAWKIEADVVAARQE